MRPTRVRRLFWTTAVSTAVVVAPHHSFSSAFVLSTRQQKQKQPAIDRHMKRVFLQQPSHHEPSVASSPSSSQQRSNGLSFPRTLSQMLAALGLSLTLLFGVPLSTAATENLVPTPLSTTAASTATATATAPTTTSTTTSTPAPRRRLITRDSDSYWTIQDTGSLDDKRRANRWLLEHAMIAIQTLYYDISGGIFFDPLAVHQHMQQWMATHDLAEREVAEEGLHHLLQELQDPFSQYMSRDQLRASFTTTKYGFLGTGAVVELPPRETPRVLFGYTTTLASPVIVANSVVATALLSSSSSLPLRTIAPLPVVTAVIPDSPAERAGITVGDRIVGIPSLGLDFRHYSSHALQHLVPSLSSADNYVGYPELRIAKPILSSLSSSKGADQPVVVVGYRPHTVTLPTATTTLQGTAPVHYRIVQSIFDHDHHHDHPKVGYIRLTRFSRSATDAFLEALQALEQAGVSSYIVDLRNNYGGIIQEAMLLASSLLRDPHAVLCYTMNAHGSFTPHTVYDYMIDARYPGYWLSHEPHRAALMQLRGASAMTTASNLGVMPDVFSAPKRGIPQQQPQPAVLLRQLALQKNIVLLINEGTASSAEVFASALHDNGRTVALVGTKTYGKGLIQHIFPMPDGGGLRLTIAEYLTPALHHVTLVGGAQFDPTTQERIGGGIRPDVVCESTQGIPSNIGADLCVGVALDVLEEAASSPDGLMRMGGYSDGSHVRRPVSGGVFQVGLTRYGRGQRKRCVEISQGGRLCLTSLRSTPRQDDF